MIDITKTYRTVSGKRVRILCTDAGGDYPVVALFYIDEDTTTVNRLTACGMYWGNNGSSEYDLVEVNPWDGLDIDTPVWFKDKYQTYWRRGHFAGVDSDGDPHVWQDGCTSHTVSTYPTLFDDTLFPDEVTPNYPHD